MGLSNGLVKIYKGFIEILVWLFWIGATVAGALLSKFFMYDLLMLANIQINISDWLLMVIGALVGAIGGLLALIAIVPPLLILFKIHSELVEMNRRRQG